MYFKSKRLKMWPPYTLYLLRFLFLDYHLFQWFSSNDSEGRVYFFEENSNESSWTLPDFGDAGRDVSTGQGFSIPLEIDICVLVLCVSYISATELRCIKEC
jgi:hypothetical protein